MKIAIVGGGGAGLACAWLLEESHEVTLFEKSERLGGHLETLTIELDGKLHTVDAGVHFFSEQLQPTFVRLVRILGAPFTAYDSAATFFDRRDGFCVCMPPFGNLARCSALVSRRGIGVLKAMHSVIDHAIDLVEGEGDLFLTLEQFLEQLDLPEDVRREFLVPYLGSYWGVLPEEVLGYSARNVTCYLVRHRPPLIKPRPSLRMVGGMKTYVERLTASLSRTEIRREVVGSLGDLKAYDRIVVATNAVAAAELLTGPRAELLRGIEYHEATIAVHGDASFMPRDRSRWSSVNAIYDGRSCALTNWQGDNRGVELFRSWITHADRTPERCHAVVKYLHPRPNRAYFAAQRDLAPHQGQDGIWLAGMYAAGYDNHEGALASAIQVARGLAPDAPRLARLTYCE
jgi:predicted NAD/FAD-binding protein